MFGSIKVFKFPMFLVYDPDFFKMDGEHISEALAILKPGDVMLRGYDSYLDGKFIDDPHGYSHGAIYVGKGKVIHAVAKGVSEEHAIDFMECDRICILRPKKCTKSAIAYAKKFLKDSTPYDFLFEYGANAMYCFELCAYCYPKLDIRRLEIKKFFGLVKRYAYLADSFRESGDFTTMLEYNPKFSIDKKARINGSTKCK